MVDGSESGATGGGRKRRRSLRGEVGRTGARFGSSSLRRTLEEEGVEPPHEPEHLAAAVPKPRRGRRSLRGEVGQTGARFGSPSLRRTLEQEPTPVEETAPFDQDFDRDLDDDFDHVESIPEPRYQDAPRQEPHYEETGKSLVRPYTWTGGRTTSDHDLRLETLISVNEEGVRTAMRSSSPEQRSVVEMCALPRSVAEVSAVLSIPLGVARVLLSDLIDMGAVSVHETNGGSAGGQTDLLLLERVLSGLRRL
ncbi:DUF742 domain-containing protein [Umezawaea sp. Da 62-37]|uniref:DUF742 domain-containing protein n=1 Tax=Umezawaea sp. Da 62-37 TaxID=3075927 RepID=UPI0028F71D11|nr:DUF742 domain-containing protein [Umezawaea sp. Da 62-37]WNV91823.1 DUF742 domain-containing protein [Umezawaea sp. Da 62-37]